MLAKSFAIIGDDESAKKELQRIPNYAKYKTLELKIAALRRETGRKEKIRKIAANLALSHSQSSTLFIVGEAEGWAGNKTECRKVCSMPWQRWIENHQALLMMRSKLRVF